MLKIKRSKEKIRNESKIKIKIANEQQEKLAEQKSVALKKQVPIQSEPVVITTNWEIFD